MALRGYTGGSLCIRGTTEIRESVALVFTSGFLIDSQFHSSHCENEDHAILLILESAVHRKRSSLPLARRLASWGLENFGSLSLLRAFMGSRTSKDRYSAMGEGVAYRDGKSEIHCISMEAMLH